MRFALFGAGFWARTQLAARGGIPGARRVALFNRARAKTERLAADFGVPAAYDDAAAPLDREKPDFVDIVTDPSTPCHANLLAARRGEGAAETTADDNLKTPLLVFGAYASARSGRTETLS